MRGISGSSLTGLIPARAGKTDALARRRKMATAHPRACGENRHVIQSAAPTPGSSPRVRGKHRVGGLLGDDAGLIPARAGKTAASRTEH